MLKTKTPIWNSEFGPTYQTAEDGEGWEEINKARYEVLKLQLKINRDNNASYSLWTYKGEHDRFGTVQSLMLRYRSDGFGLPESRFTAGQAHQAIHAAQKGTLSNRFQKKDSADSSRNYARMHGRMTINTFNMSLGRWKTGSRKVYLRWRKSTLQLGRSRSTHSGWSEIFCCR